MTSTTTVRAREDKAVLEVACLEPTRTDFQLNVLHRQGFLCVCELSKEHLAKLCDDIYKELLVSPGWQPLPKLEPIPNNLAPAPTSGESNNKAG